MQGIDLEPVKAVAEAMAMTDVDPDQARRDEVIGVDFHPYFVKQNEMLKQRGAPEWKPIFMRWLRHTLYYTGNQTPIMKSNGWGYDVYTLKDNASKHRIITINRLREYSDEEASLWMSINPKIELVILNANIENQQRKLDAFNNLKQHFNYRNNTPQFITRASKQGQWCGPYIAEIFFDADGRDGYEYRQKRQRIDVPAKLAGTCLQCQAYNEFPISDPTQPQQVPQCSQCGCSYMNLQEIPGGPAEVLVGGEWARVGDVRRILDESWHSRYSLTVGPDLSPWRYHERDEVKESVEFEFGKLEGAWNESVYADDEVMHPGRIVRRAERMRGMFQEIQSEEEYRLIQRFYYEPEMLHFIKLNRPEKLPNGFTIPANVRLSEVFPETGLCIKTSPGLPYFLDAYPESHKRRFVNGMYGETPGRAIAHGNDEAPNYQKWYNLLASGHFDHTLKTLQPSTLVIEEVFPDGNLWNREDRLIKIQKSQLANVEKGLQGVMYQMPPPTINQSVVDGMQLMGAELQRSQKVDSYATSADKGVNPDTATAARIGEGRMMRSNSFLLANFASFGAKCLKREIEIARENYGEQRVITTKDPQRDARINMILKKTDIDVDVEFYVVQDSYLPDLKVEKQAAYKEGMDTLAVAISAGIDRQRAVKSINQHFNIDINCDNNPERIAACEDSLDGVKELYAAGVIDPLALFEAYKVDPMEVGHEAKMTWWRDWKSSPEGRQADPMLRLVADLFIQAHAAAFMLDRTFVANVAAIGLGLLAPPQNAGLTAGDQNPSALLAAMKPDQANIPGAATAPGAGMDRVPGVGEQNPNENVTQGMQSPSSSQVTGPNQVM